MLDTSSFVFMNNTTIPYMSEDMTGISYSIEGDDSTYDGSGIVIDINNSLSTQGMINLMTDLSNQSFVSLSTRAVIIEATLYNPSLNLFAYMRLVFWIF